MSAALTIHAKFDAMVHEVFDSEPSLVALLARCSRLSLNATSDAAQLLAAYCALQLSAAHDSRPSSAVAPELQSPGSSSGSSSDASPWGGGAGWSSPSRACSHGDPRPPAAYQLLKQLGFGASDAEVHPRAYTNPPPPILTTFRVVELTPRGALS